MATELTEEQVEELERESQRSSQNAADVATRSFLLGRYVPVLLAERKAMQRELYDVLNQLELARFALVNATGPELVEMVTTAGWLDIELPSDAVEITPTHRAVPIAKWETMQAKVQRLSAIGGKLLLFKRKLKHSDPEEYERGKESLWDALEAELPDWAIASGQSDPMDAEGQ